MPTIEEILAEKNFHIGPSSEWIIKGMVADWCKKNPMPEVFDENDSWHWALMEMHDLLSKLRG